MTRQPYLDSDDDSDDGDFISQNPGPSNRKKQAPLSKQKMTDADLKRKKTRERVAKSRAKETPQKRQQRLREQAERQAAARARETPQERHQRNRRKAEREAAARANETPQEHQQRISEQADRQAEARANETPQEH